MATMVLGTVQFGIEYGINNNAGKPATDLIARLLELAWENGISEIDTAQVYGSSEVVLGECFRKLPLNFKVHSKFIDSGISVQEAINISLKNLGVKKLGYFYFHKYSDYLAYRLRMPAGEELSFCDGLAVSVYSEEEMRTVLRDSFIKAIQIPLNLLDYSREKQNLIIKAKTLGKDVYVRSVFLQGLFFMSPDKLPLKLKSLKPALLELNNLCIENNLNMRELALGFINSTKGIDGVLIGVDSEDQLHENIQSKNIELSDELIEKIKKIYISDRSLLLPVNWN